MQSKQHTLYQIDDTFKASSDIGKKYMSMFGHTARFARITHINKEPLEYHLVTPTIHYTQEATTRLFVCEESFLNDHFKLIKHTTL